MASSDSGPPLAPDLRSLLKSVGMVSGAAGHGFRNLVKVLRANPLTLVGFVLVVFLSATAFLVVVTPPVTQVLFGSPSSITPFDPNGLVDEKNIPPWTNAPVLRNESFQSNRTTPWVNAANANRVDGIGAVSNRTGDFLVATNFPMGIKRNSIESVGFAVWLIPNGTDPGQYVAIRVSFNGGTTWSPKYSVRSVGRDVRVDVTNLTTWDVSKLSTTSLYLNVTHESDAGTTGNVSLDYLGATAIWRSYWHLMGSDTSGRDLFSRLLVALPLDLAIGFAIAGFALLLGGGLGLVAGFWDKPGTFGGVISLTIMRVTDVFLAFPSLVLALAIAATLGRGTGPSVLAVLLTWWPYYVRLTRGEVLAVKHQPYVTAAKAAGVSGGRILFRHVLRNILEPLIVYFTMDVGTVLVVFSTISFVGIGVPASVPEWGNMIEAYGDYLLLFPWMVIFPGLAIFVTVLAFSLLGDGLRDILDPRSRRALTQAAIPATSVPATSARSEA